MYVASQFIIVKSFLTCFLQTLSPGHWNWQLFTSPDLSTSIPAKLLENYIYFNSTLGKWGMLKSVFITIIHHQIDYHSITVHIWVWLTVAVEAEAEADNDLSLDGVIFGPHSHRFVGQMVADIFSWTHIINFRSCWYRKMIVFELVCWVCFIQN